MKKKGRKNEIAEYTGSHKTYIFKPTIIQQTTTTVIAVAVAAAVAARAKGAKGAKRATGSRVRSRSSIPKMINQLQNFRG